MKETYIRKITINKGQNLIRLDQALSKLTDFSRSQIKILLKKGSIKKNGEVINEASYKVKTGEIYVFESIIPEEKKFSPEKIPLKIIFEDNDLIIINKQAGLVVHPAPGNYNGTLVNALLNYNENQLSSINGNERPGIVHRLDKETSGLMVVAKNNNAHLNLAKQFSNHSISRKYTAIVWGVPQNQIIEGHIERHKVNRKKMALNKKEKGKYSCTEIKLIKSFQIASVVECKLKTGRTHQVRLHLTSINSPLVGDKIYGKNKINQFGKDQQTFNKFLVLKNFSRHALHANHLGFTHPKTNKYMEFNNELPEDMLNLLDLILKY